MNSEDGGGFDLWILTSLKKFQGIKQRIPWRRNLQSNKWTKHKPDYFDIFAHHHQSKLETLYPPYQIQIDYVKNNFQNQEC